MEGLRVTVDARLGEREMFPDARERDCRGGAAGGELVVLEPEEAVCAVREAGSLIGRVGERGLGFWNPIPRSYAGALASTLGFAAAVAVEVLGGRLTRSVFEAWVGANEAGAGFFSGSFATTLLDSFLLGVVGVLGSGDFTDFDGDFLVAIDVFAVDMGVGLVVLVAAGFSMTFSVVGFDVPFVCPVLFSSCGAIGFVSFFKSPLPCPSCLSTSTGGVSTAVSGINSARIELRFLA